MTLKLDTQANRSLFLSGQTLLHAIIGNINSSRNAVFVTTASMPPLISCLGLAVLIGVEAHEIFSIAIVMSSAFATNCKGRTLLRAGSSKRLQVVSGFALRLPRFCIGFPCPRLRPWIGATKYIPCRFVII